MMNLGDGLTRWTIRAAILLLAICCAGRQLAGADAAWRKLERALWPLGCLLFLAHIAAGMHYFHHWSHQAAYADTAEQTEALLGVAWGEGIYVNYLMAIVWSADALWLVFAPEAYRKRSPWIEGGVLGFFLFIAFNGTVVFKSGWLRIT
ncbi:MAG: hypothetical protein ACIALR_13720, partial [Blastopirellula sp. JB062]